MIMIFALAVAASPAPPLRSGQYDELMLAVAPDGQVLGRIYETRGDGPYFSCEVLFAGRVGKDGRVAGVSWADGEAPHPATLRGTASGAEMIAPGASSYPGCGMTMGSELDGPIPLSRSAPAAWTTLLRVVAPRPPLRPSPHEGAARRPYVVKGDVVALVARQSGWLKVDYASDSGRRPSGWLREDEVTAIRPPSPRR